MRRVLRTALAGVGAVATCVVLYLGAALVLGLIPVNTDFEDAAGGTEVFLVSNGIHVDFVLPVRTPLIDWSELLPHDEFTRVDASYRHIIFGWGERRFYIETPTWADLKVSTLAAAMLWPTTSAMHVQYTRGRPMASEATRRVVLSDAQYRTLARLIRESFQTDADGGLRRIAGKAYGDTDNFYEGEGTYHLFFTCNGWTNRLLKETGVRTALWSPFTRAILYHLE